MEFQKCAAKIAKLRTTDLKPFYCYQSEPMMGREDGQPKEQKKFNSVLLAYQTTHVGCSGSPSFKLHRENSPINRLTVTLKHIKYLCFGKPFIHLPCQLPSLLEFMVENYKRKDFSEFSFCY